MKNKHCAQLFINKSIMRKLLFGLQPLLFFTETSVCFKINQFSLFIDFNPIFPLVIIKWDSGLKAKALLTFSSKMISAEQLE